MQPHRVASNPEFHRNHNCLCRLSCIFKKLEEDLNNIDINMTYTYSMGMPTNVKIEFELTYVVQDAGNALEWVTRTPTPKQPDQRKRLNSEIKWFISTSVEWIPWWRICSRVLFWLTSNFQPRICFRVFNFLSARRVDRWKLITFSAMSEIVIAWPAMHIIFIIPRSSSMSADDAIVRFLLVFYRTSRVFFD